MYTNHLTKRLACNRNLLNSDHTHYHQYYLLLERKSTINRMEWKLNAESLQPGNCHLIAPGPSLNQISVSSKLERTPCSSLNPTSETKAPPVQGTNAAYQTCSSAYSHLEAILSFGFQPARARSPISSILQPHGPNHRLKTGLLFTRGERFYR